VTAPPAWWVEYATLESIGKFLDPLASFCVSSIVQSLLESVKNHPIGALDLSIGPWITETYRTLILLFSQYSKN
jgi:hypothetical protein